MQAIDPYISDLYRSTNIIPLAQYRKWSMRQLAEVIPFDAALWLTGTLLPIEVHTSTLIDLPAEFQEALARTRGENPMVRKLLADPTQSLRMSDVQDLDSFKASWLYTECFAPQGIQYILSNMSVNPRSGLMTLITLYRHADSGDFSEAERDLHGSACYHLCEAAAHGQFLHLQRNPEARQGPRPQTARAAICDRHGIFHAAQQGFLDLLDSAWPGWTKGRLPFALPTDGEPLHSNGLCIVAEDIDQDLLSLQAWEESPLDTLSSREQRIVELVCQGQTFKEVARRLELAPSTISNHLYRVYGKLGINSRAELAQLVYPESSN